MDTAATENDGGIEENELAAQDELARKIQGFVDNFGTTPDVWINIYDVLADGNKSFLRTIPLDDISPTQMVNQIANEYGPGMYEAHGRRNNESGKEVLAFRQAFQIGRKTKGYKPESRESGRGNGADDSAIAQALQLNNQLLQRLLEKDTAPPAQPNMFETMETFSKIKSLFEPPAASTNMLALVKDVLALKDQLLGDEQPRDALSMAMEKFVPMISDAVGKMQDHDAAGGQGGLLKNVGDAPVSMPHPMLKMLEQFLPAAIMAASMNVEPEKAAGVVIGQIATNLPLRNALAEFLDDDLALEKLAKINSGVLQRRDWFDEFIDQLLMILKPDDPREMAEAQTDFQEHLDKTDPENKDLENSASDPDDKKE